MQSSIPKCRVTMFDALDPDGETHPKCRIAINGTPASVVLYGPVDDRIKAIDRLTGATVTENADGTLTIVGRSDELVNVVGVDPSNAQVRWEVEPYGCKSC